MRHRNIDKKNVIIIILSIALVFSGIGNIILNLEMPIIPHPNDPLIVGISTDPSTIDPINSTDSLSCDIINQICEGLFQYDLSDLSLPRINHLTETYWWENSTTLHLKVRENIFFHDKYPFNSSAVKWNLDRLNYLINASGTLPSDKNVAKAAELFKFSDGSPIIDHVSVINEWNLTITLSDAFAPFLDLLCCTSSYMLSPVSTPADDYIPLTGPWGSPTLVGTGPFAYQYYIPDVELICARFNDYWQGKAFLNGIIYAIIRDTTTRCKALSAHEFDYYFGPLPFCCQPDSFIKIIKFSEIYDLPDLTYQYLGMNNELISPYWRKAISYAINYTYIIDEIMAGLGIRANGPISPSYGAAYNASNHAADYDLLVSRQTLVDAGIAPGFPINNDPNDATWLSATLASFNYTYNIGNSFREDMLDALNAWLPAIGVTVVDDGVTWPAYLRKLFSDYDELGLFWIGWNPDYKDPFNMLDPLFNPISYANSAQVNDTKLNTMIALALETTDDTARNTIYKNIQWYLSNRLYPHCFGYHSKIIYIHSANLRGVQYNALNKFYAYPIYRA